MINHSISNKMVSMSSIIQINSDNLPDDSLRRRRTPSKFADSIKELTKVNKYSPQITSKSSKRDKNSEENQVDSHPPPISSPDISTFLNCVLPTSNRTLKISIVVRGEPDKPKQFNIVKPVPIERVLEKEKQKDRQKNTNLLQAFMQVVEKYQHVDKQQKKDQNKGRGNQSFSSELDFSKREPRARRQKDDDQKYIRLHEKYRNFIEKLENLQSSIVLI